MNPMECSERVLHTTVLNSQWYGCKKIVGECQWIVDHGKCPRDQRTGVSER